MSPSYKYAIAQLAANPVRGERLNLAIVVFDGDRLEVHAARNLDKIRAISAAMERSVVEQSLQNLTVLDNMLRNEGLFAIEDRLQSLSEMSSLSFSPVGQFFASDAVTYESSIKRLLGQLVEPEPAERSRRAIQEIGIAALVFEQARIKFGDLETKPRLVYSATANMENSISPALHAAEHQGADLVNWDSRDDRTRFIVDISSLAEPAESQQRAKFGTVHASRLENLN